MLSDELYGIYTRKIYPVLAHNDPVYQRSLLKAGLGWTASNIAPAHRASFEQEMKLQAFLGAAKIRDAKSLDAGTIRVKEIDGPQTLYRVSQSGRNDPPGIWWFNEKVAQRCREEAGPNPQKRLDWLRNVLAVCFNFSNFDRVEVLPLHASESLPAVLGRGLPMGHYKVDPYVDRKTGEHVVTLPADYWQQKGKTLIGGELQIVLPWVPVRRVRPGDL